MKAGTTKPRSRARSMADLVGRLSPEKRELIRVVLEHPREYVLLSLRRLARELDADPMTTLRIVRDMGFSSYPEFQRYLHEVAMARVTPLELMEATGREESNAQAGMQAALDRASRNLQAVRNSIDFDRVGAVAKRLYGARLIVILGGDVASNLARFLQYHLAVVGLPSLAPVTPGEMIHTVRGVGRGDVVIAISFRRGLRQTVESMRQAKARGAYCVGVTDTYVSPVARFADEFLLASVEGLMGGSYVAPMALLDVLLAACANYRRARTIRLLKEADEEQRDGFRWYREE